MKTTAFLIRVAICFLLSLIPVTELENRIYSARMGFRGQWTNVPNLLLVAIDPPYSSSRSSLKSLENNLKAQGASVVLLSSSDAPAHLIADSDGVVRSAVALPKKGNPESPHLINYAGPA